MSLKLRLIQGVLKLLIFIDFLEDLPQKTIKYCIKIGGLTLVSIILLLLLATEVQHQTLSRLVSHLLIPESRLNYSTPAVMVGKPALKRHLPFPPVTARALLVADLNSDSILKEVDSELPYPPASTTKIVTALIARDLYNLDELLVTPEECTKVESQKMGFVKDEVIQVRDLIASLIIGSAGDSACILAYGKVPYGQYIALMNKKTKELEALNTHFSNPIGLDDANAQHYASARDLFLISKAALQDEFLVDLFASHSYTLGTGLIERTAYSTNQLLTEVEGTVGIKTGTTYQAGEVLIYQYKKGKTNLIIIVMGSVDRFGDTKKILEWALASFVFN